MIVYYQRIVNYFKYSVIILSIVLTSRNEINPTKDIQLCTLDSTTVRVETIVIVHIKNITSIWYHFIEVWHQVMGFYYLKTN